MLLLHNFNAEGRTVKFRSMVQEGEPDCLVNLLSDDHSDVGKDGRHHVTLEPYGYRWYRVGALDYVLKRSEI